MQLQSGSIFLHGAMLCYLPPMCFLNMSFVYFFGGSISSFQSLLSLEETSWSLGMALGPLLTGWVSNFNETGSCNDACALGILNSIRPCKLQQFGIFLVVQKSYASWCGKYLEISNYLQSLIYSNRCSISSTSDIVYIYIPMITHHAPSKTFYVQYGRVELDLKHRIFRKYLPSPIFAYLSSCVSWILLTTPRRALLLFGTVGLLLRGSIWMCISRSVKATGELPSAGPSVTVVGKPVPQNQ